MAKRKRKVWPKPNWLRLYSWRDDRRASRDCIKHFVAKAIERKNWASNPPQWVAEDQECAARGGTRSVGLQSFEEARDLSLHALARKALEYERHRAFATVGSNNGGGYLSANWPIDRPARDLWLKLNPEAIP